MQDDRTAFLLRKRELMPLTEAEQAELAATPEFVGERDASGRFVAGVMVVPRRPSGDYQQQLRAFAAMMNTDNSPPTPEQVEAFVNGDNPIGKHAGTHNEAPPVDEWADDVEPPPPPVAAQAPTPPATPPQVPVIERPAPEAPDDQSPVQLPANHTYVRTLPTGEIVALFKDESLPRSPAREVILSPKRLRKQRAQTARAAMKMRRASDDGGRKLSF
jgi:hypothetical protein